MQGWLGKAADAKPRVGPWSANARTGRAAPDPVFLDLGQGFFAMRHPSGMAHPLKVEIPHQLGRAEARRRIERGFENFARQLPGGTGTCTQRWEGDRLTFSLAAMGQTVPGRIDVLETSVAIEVDLPGLLGQIASAFKGRLQKAGQLLLTKD